MDVLALWGQLLARHHPEAAAYLGPGEGEGGKEEEVKEEAKEEEEKGGRRRGKIVRTRYPEEYRCDSCPYTCTTERAYLKHFRFCDDKSSNLPLSCPVCGKNRYDDIALSVHMEKHRDGRHFCCDLCKFKSIQLKKIIQHRRMHTGEKPHLCPHCCYRSSRRDNLRCHVRRMHKKRDLDCDTFVPRKMFNGGSKGFKSEEENVQ